MPQLTVADYSESVVTVYAIAGIGTSEDFMEGLLLELERRYFEQTGGAGRIRSALLHPYGAWDRSLLAQLREMRRDLWLRLGRRAGSLGGRRVLQRIEADGAATAGPLWLVGHSGGGIAAVHAAEALLAAYGAAADCRLAQIGSPRCAVPEPLQARTAYVYAARAGSRRPADPICRLGSWGGWERASRLGLRWNRLRHAPATVAPLPLVGGHADYFRDHGVFRQAEGGATNLQLTVDAMWPTLMKGAGGQPQ
jgi:hypothetical protein